MEFSSLGINFIGHVSGEFGLGEGARSTLRSLEAVGIPISLQDVRINVHRNRECSYTNFSNNQPYAINLVHTNPNILELDSIDINSSYFQGNYNIGYWAWELSNLPEKWQPAFELFDEIWTPSNFCAEAISQRSPIPVVKVAHSIDLPQPSSNRVEVGLPQGKFIFFFMFDFWSTFERKNPLAVIAAFKQAFGSHNQNVLLAIKSSNSHYFPQEQSELERIIHDCSSIRYIDGHLSREEVNALLYHCDCYVSLHRSEGFGLTMAEAMFYGKPVIGTAYSGNTDFMNVGNSFLVPYELVQLTEDCEYYLKGNVWANPDIEYAASLMKYIYEHQHEAIKIGARAGRDIKQFLNSQVIGRRIENRFKRVIFSSQSKQHLKAIRGAWKALTQDMQKELWELQKTDGVS
jgi:glycosyltransferase involved in cell wall biosynthesis